MAGMSSNGVDPGSFRDPSGFVFQKDGRLYRQINTIYKDDYDRLINTGLYQRLVKEGLLITHQEVEVTPHGLDACYRVIKPEELAFISYPYEWCFSQLKDAALVTLKIQKICLEYGMSLKDASAYNIQFVRGKPVLIDTLSFEAYREGHPWIAYRQFCQQFLAPLALMNYRDVRLNQILRVFSEGFPLDMASSLLPLRTRFMFSLFSHIHLHAKSQKKFAKKNTSLSRHRMSRMALSGIIDSLESAVKRLKWKPNSTEWAEYYRETNYSSKAFEHKKEMVSAYLDTIKAQNVWDLGSNVGTFSRIASQKGIPVISMDVDPGAVEKNYLDICNNGEVNILPLVSDLSNPSPGIGWNNLERRSLSERGPANTVMALALVHHLAISCNVPLEMIAGFFSRICRNLIIEFVPKHDSQVQKLLSAREDVFESYTQQSFEKEFGRYFKLCDISGIDDSQRIMYLMEAVKK